MHFLGFDLHQRIPDVKTIWLFRETLAQTGGVETLFKQFDTFLAEQGLQARGGQFMDASLIPVPKQRNTREKNATVKAGECPAEWEVQLAKRRQKDTDARWTRKHGVSHFGYKNHANVDKQYKLIRRYVATDAAVHDSQVLEEVVQPKTAGRDVWEDAVYWSNEIEQQLKKRRLQSKIQYKAYRAKPLTAKQQHTNQPRSWIRAPVEHVFGHQVTAMGGKLLRTRGRVRARV